MRKRQKHSMTIKNNSTRERDQFIMVLEAIQSDFQVFGEKIDMMEERMNARFDAIENRLDRMEVRVDAIELRLDRIELRLNNIEIELANIKLEISDLKTKLDKKVDMERLERLENRVRHIEAVLVKEKRK